MMDDSPDASAAEDGLSALAGVGGVSAADRAAQQRLDLAIARKKSMDQRRAEEVRVTVAGHQSKAKIDTGRPVSDRITDHARSQCRRTKMTTPGPSAAERAGKASGWESCWMSSRPPGHQTVANCVYPLWVAAGRQGVGDAIVLESVFRRECRRMPTGLRTFLSEDLQCERRRTRIINQ